MTSKGRGNRGVPRIKHIHMFKNRVNVDVILNKGAIAITTMP